jgi:hypothetical protein
MSLRKPVTSLIVATLIAGAASPATAQPPPWAQTPADCLDAIERGQDVRAQRKLMEARVRFAQCGADICPSAIRRDCLQFLAETESSLPTVVFAARTSEGQDLRGVLLVLDDNRAKPLDEIGGQAIALDPGPHNVRFDTPGGLSSTVQFVAAEGEKNRRVIATFATHDRAPAPVRPVAQGVQPVQHVRSTTAGESLVWPIVTGSVSLLTLGGFAYFGVSGRSELSDIRATGCAPRCNESDVSSAHDKLVVGDVLLGVGIVALAATVWLLVRREGHNSAPATAATFAR